MEQKLIDFIAKVLEIDSARISLNTFYGEIPEWDSYSHILLIAEIEREFRIEIPISKIFEIKTVNDFLSLLK
jgi:acyl carrier protein